MDDSPKIPVVSMHKSASESGLNVGNLAIAAAERHPVDVMQRSGPTTNPYQDLNFVRSVYGSGIAMEMAAERQLARAENDLGMSKIGGLYEDIVTGNQSNLQFSDFMSLPDNRSELPKSVFHLSMDRQLKNL
jgi:Proteasome maturation factor UMP1